MTPPAMIEAVRREAAARMTVERFAISEHCCSPCDEVFPEVPVRQWVCSMPWQHRYAMGYDRQLCADVLDIFIVAICGSTSLENPAT
jgi:hypothetical protein